MKQAVYISGLGHGDLDISVKSYAVRLMKAIDENAENKNNTYRIEASERNYDSEGNITDVVSIFESDDNSEN